jgi:hypothetical protein
MSRLAINVPHQLPKEEALTRIKNLLVNVKEEQKHLIDEVKEEWNGDEGAFTFSAKGFELAGKIRVNEGSVDIDGELPFMLSLFKDKISSVIQEKAAKLLG